MKNRLIALLASVGFLCTTSQLPGANRRVQISGARETARSRATTTSAGSAKSEGEAVIYANMDVAAMKPLTEGFMKRYPGTKAASVHFSGAAIITRIDSEARAGKPLSDVVLSGQLGVLALIDKKVAARYRSPEREFYPRGF